jgi:protease I
MTQKLNGLLLRCGTNESQTKFVVSKFTEAIMDNKLQGKKVAILATDGFEQSELIKPRAALQEAGAAISVISPKGGEIKGWDTDDWGDNVKADVVLSEASAEDYDALVLPGGVMNPDKLRIDEQAISFVKSFFETGKPVAAICHGHWTLINAEVVKGRQLTSYPTLRKDWKMRARDGLTKKLS